MELYAALFIIGFLVCIGILLFKMYNVLNMCTVYSWPVAIILFIGYFLSWFVCFVVLMQDVEQLIYSTLLYLLNWLIIINVMLFIAETFLGLKGLSIGGGEIKAYRSREDDRRVYSPQR